HTTHCEYRIAGPLQQHFEAERADLTLEPAAPMFEITTMTIHRIRLLGDPVLRSRSEVITKPRSAAVRMIIDDLRETLRDWQSRFGSGRGIAAPQIGAPVRMVYVEMDRPWPLINPEIIDIGTDDFSVWDDCFSFPT